MTLNFRIVRERLKLERPPVAKAIGVSVNQLWRWETEAGRLPADVLIQLSDYYGLSPRTLMQKDGAGLPPENAPLTREEEEAAPSQEEAVQIEDALSMYHQQLVAFATKGLLPLDDDTIALAIDVMRDTMVQDAKTPDIEEMLHKTDVIALQAKRKKSTAPE